MYVFCNYCSKYNHDVPRCTRAEPDAPRENTRKHRVLECLIMPYASVVFDLYVRFESFFHDELASVSFPVFGTLDSDRDRCSTLNLRS